MTNFERHFSSVEDVADFILRHTTCFVCPVECAGRCEFTAFDICEDKLRAWLLEECEE